MPYVAIMNTPGYMPWSDEDPPEFEKASDAWAYLADERRSQEDDTEEAEYSETVDQLDAYSQGGATWGTIYGGTPGYDGDHDLGIAYSVTETAP